MSAGTHIEWTDATWNPVTGCTRVSSGCDHCYAAAMTHRIASMGRSLKISPAQRAHAERYYGLTIENAKGDRHFNGKVRCHDEVLELPLNWKKPRRIFVNSMSDLFHEAVPFEFIKQVFGVMAVSPEHTYQILTKRVRRAAQFLSERGDVIDAARRCLLASDSRRLGFLECEAALPLQNVWLGTSIESADHWNRAEELAACPAAVRFWSLEPLLGPLGKLPIRQLAIGNRQSVDWAIVGGESGPGARPMHPDWVRSIRDQCASAGVPFFFKQWGEWRPSVESDSTLAEMVRVGKKAAGHLLDGEEWRQYPGDGSVPTDPRTVGAVS